MSATTASLTDIVTVLVRLLDEGVDVWRPVAAHRVSSVTYRLAETPAPADETGSFSPGQTVVAEMREHGAGPVLYAVPRASAYDTRSLAAFAG